MKVRTGFVSNSSSSSFVVAFPREPKDKNDLFRLLFPEGKAELSYYNRRVDTSTAVDIIWHDLENQEPMSVEEIEAEVGDGYFPGVPDMFDYEVFSGTPEERDARWERYRRDRDEAARRLAQSFVESNQGALFYKFHYGDEMGPPLDVMEHGDVFESLPHIRVSHH